MGKATKDHVGEDPNWDVYTLTSVMGGWMKEVFATHLKLEDHYAKEIVLFALQAQQARTSRAHGHFPFEYEVTHSMVFAFHVLRLCITVVVAICWIGRSWTRCFTWPQSWSYVWARVLSLLKS